MKKLSLIFAILTLVLSAGCSDTKQTSATYETTQNKDYFASPACDFIRDFSLKSGINMELNFDFEFDDYISYTYENVGDKKEIKISINENIENKKIDHLTIIFFNELLPETYCTTLKLLDTSITTDKQAIAIYNTLIEKQKDSSSGMGHAKTDKCSYLMEIAESGTIYISIKKL